MTQPILTVHIYPLAKTHSILGGKKHYPRGGGILSSGKNAFYPRGKNHIYPMVSDTLSSGKWHIILWEKKLIKKITLKIY